MLGLDGTVSFLPLCFRFVFRLFELLLQIKNFLLPLIQKRLSLL